MKGKLHKMESGYILSLNGDIDDPYAIVNKELAEDYGWYKLSLKNCQAIEVGYDLDELAKKEILYNDQKREWWKQGAKYILEILGDKKFSEEDIDKAFNTGVEMLDSPRRYNDVLEELKKSLQQTEWEVTFNPDEKDADGCLILKRIK